ncbi:hypothetical protein ACHQM5_014339 [Ranunculus cassubicifolius]
MDSFQEDCNWNILDYSRIIEDDSSTDFYWNNQSACVELDVSAADIAPTESGCTRKRGRNESCGGPGSKACREKMRRDKLNDRFADLSSILEPGRPAKTDKSAILSDAIRVVNQLRSESQELKEANEKLQEDIKNLKAEKIELREEKSSLKADKERIEQQVKAMAIVPGAGMLPPPHPAAAAYQAGMNKFMAYPSYGGYPMWQYISPASLDTSQDHVLRPPVA